MIKTGGLSWALIDRKWTVGESSANKPLSGCRSCCCGPHLPIISHRSFAVSPLSIKRKRTRNVRRFYVVVLIDLNDDGAERTENPRTEMNWQSSSLTRKSGTGGGPSPLARYRTLTDGEVSPSPPHNSLWIMDEARAQQSSYNSCHQRGWRSAETEKQQHEQQEATTSKPYSFAPSRTGQKRGQYGAPPQWIGIFCCPACAPRAQQQSSIQSSIHSHSAYRFEVIWASGETPYSSWGKTQ